MRWIRWRRGGIKICSLLVVLFLEYNDIYYDFEYYHCHYFSDAILHIRSPFDQSCARSDHGDGAYPSLRR